jgi:uncharacterized protein YgiM (DUF1202 family)
MSRVFATLSGILVLALFAGGLTEATMALGRHGGLTNDISLRPKPSPVTPSTPAATATPSVSVAPTPTPTATPVPTPSYPTATTVSFVHLRSAKSTSSAILTDLNGGTVVRLLPDADAQWQQVQVNGLTGYIFKTYLAY